MERRWENFRGERHWNGRVRKGVRRRGKTKRKGTCESDGGYRNGRAAQGRGKKREERESVGECERESQAAGRGCCTTFALDARCPLSSSSRALCLDMKNCRISSTPPPLASSSSWSPPSPPFSLSSKSTPLAASSASAQTTLASPSAPRVMWSRQSRRALVCCGWRRRAVTVRPPRTFLTGSASRGRRAGATPGRQSRREVNWGEERILLVCRASGDGREAAGGETQEGATRGKGEKIHMKRKVLGV